jgi:hypothetical protein
MFHRSNDQTIVCFPLIGGLKADRITDQALLSLFPFATVNTRNTA